MFGEGPDGFFALQAMVNFLSVRFTPSHAQEMSAYYSVKKTPQRASGHQQPQSESDIIEGMVSKLSIAMQPRLGDLLMHFRRLNLQLDQFCYSWFCNYFASCLPTHILKKIWDKVIALGENMLIAYAYALLWVTKPFLLNCSTAAEALAILMLVSEQHSLPSPSHPPKDPRQGHQSVRPRPPRGH